MRWARAQVPASLRPEERSSVRAASPWASVCGSVNGVGTKRRVPHTKPENEVLGSVGKCRSVSGRNTPQSEGPGGAPHLPKDPELEM